MRSFIPVSEPKLDGNESEYLLECINSGWISSEGPFVNRFENYFAERVGRKYGIAVSNGTVALELALLTLELEKGDEVIVPSFTIISCILAILRVGAKPVLVDADRWNWNMDIDMIESKITKRTRAIMVVHTYGLPVEMNKVLPIAEKYHLKIIEDAAEMHGQTYLDQPCGSFGDISIFSFYANKLVTTGEGGMILTNNKEVAEKCRSYRNLCFNKDTRFLHDDLGYNFRITNLQAAIGLAQTERLEEFSLQKRRIGKLYTDLLENEPLLQLPITKTQYADNIYWVFGIVLHDAFPFDARCIMDTLSKLGIGTRPFFYPMHKQPALLKLGLFSGDKFPESERLGLKGFYLPTGLTLSDMEIEHIAVTLKKIISDTSDIA